MGELSNKRKYRFRLGLERAAAALAALMVAAGCSLLPQEEAELAPPLVQPKEDVFDIVEARRGTIQTVLRNGGTFTSSRSAPLYFEESGGRVLEVLVKQGDMVAAGQTVLELDVGNLETQIRLQRLNVERAQIQFEQAVRDGLTGSELRLREIDLERERIYLEEMEDRLKRSRLVAPFDGQVTFVAGISPGDTVTAFRPLVTVSDPKQVLLTYLAPSASDLFGVHPGMEGTVVYKGETYRAKVVQSPTNAPETTDKTEQERNLRTLMIGLEDPPEDARIGDSAEFEIPLQRRENVIVIPRAGLRTYLGREYVQIADGERRKEVDVEVGLMTSTEVEIVRGLEEGARVILNN
jgi:RND family efflux transporter MFP subunit